MAYGKLNDKQKQKILADYINFQNYCEVARINGVTEACVRKIVKNCDDEELKKMFEQKKEENTKDILRYMDNIYDKQKNIIDLSLDALQKILANVDEETKINVKDIATVYGVIFDKALKYEEIKVRNNESNMWEINNNINNIANLINNPKPNRKEEDIDAL